MFLGQRHDMNKTETRAEVAFYTGIGLVHMEGGVNLVLLIPMGTSVFQIPRVVSLRQDVLAA